MSSSEMSVPRSDRVSPSTSLSPMELPQRDSRSYALLSSYSVFTWKSAPKLRANWMYSRSSTTVLKSPARPMTSPTASAMVKCLS